MADAPSTTPTLTPKELARFWSYIDVRGPDECWPWLRSRNKDGYGQFDLRGKNYRAHRVAFLIANGHWPTPCGLHSCDNPPCCNAAAHISEGTKADNAAQRMERGRHRSPRGDANGSRTHPERVPRGAAHYSRTHPERLARGDAHYSRTHPERLARGDAHYSRIHPERLSRGAAHGAAQFSDEVIEAVRVATGSQREIARRFGMSQTHVGEIRRGESRKTA